MLRCRRAKPAVSHLRLAGVLAVVVALGLAAANTAAAQPPVHYWHQGMMPPGAIGSQQLLRGGPLPGFFQPVEIKAPDGVLVSLAADNQFGPDQPAPLRVGMLIGQVYRLRVSNIPLNPGMEVFPSVEVINRLYAPADQRVRFPVPIELTQEELQMALAGKFVTRVIYLEDPMTAMPQSLDGQPQSYFDVAPGQDPLAMADTLGRPMAILRLGGRLPDVSDLGDPSFFFGSPPVETYVRPAAPTVEPQPTPAAATQTAPARAYSPLAQRVLPSAPLSNSRPVVNEALPSYTAPAMPAVAETAAPTGAQMVVPAAAAAATNLKFAAPTTYETSPVEPSPEPQVKVLPPPPRRAR